MIIKRSSTEYKTHVYTAFKTQWTVAFKTQQLVSKWAPRNYWFLNATSCKLISVGAGDVRRCKEGKQLRLKRTRLLRLKLSWLCFKLSD